MRPIHMLLWLAGLFCLPCAWAVLGQPLQALPALPAANGSQPVRASLSSTVGSAQSSLYTTRVNTQADGVVITEYATPSGRVFAIAWQGPVLPPLENWLGTYFVNFQAQADASRSQRNVGTPLYIQSPNLVVRSSGRMRNFSGYAYDPQLVPGGLRINDVLP